MVSKDIKSSADIELDPFKKRDPWINTGALNPGVRTEGRLKKRSYRHAHLHPHTATHKSPPLAPLSPFRTLYARVNAGRCRGSSPDPALEQGSVGAAAIRAVGVPAKVCDEGSGGAGC